MISPENSSNSNAAETNQSEQATQPSRTPQTIFGIITALVLFIVIGLPYVLQLVIVDALEEQGADQVSINNIKLNLFSGKFSIHELEIRTGDHPAVIVDELSLHVPYWQALSNKATVKHLILKGAVVPIVQLKDGTMIIGIPLPASGETTLSKENETEETAPLKLTDWKITLQQLLLENVTVQLQTPEINNTVEIKSFEINDLTNWSEQHSRISLLTSITDLAKESTTKINANNIGLNTNQAIRIAEDTGVISLDLNGVLTMKSSSLQYEKFEIETQLESIEFSLFTEYDANKDEPLSWHVSQIKAKGLTTQLTDQNIKPAFATTLELQSLLVEKVSNRYPDNPTNLALTGTIDSHSTFSITGTAKPLAEKLSADINATIQALELVPFSSYIEDAIGYHVQSGKLNFDADLKVKQDQLDSNAGITLNNIKLTPASDEAAEKLTKQLTMPLDLMLSVLRDTDNNVHVDIPVKGDANNPDFKISDVLEQATAKATQYAAVSFLKNALQPYTTMISVAEFAYDQGRSLTALRLDPLMFQAEQTQLNDDQHSYLKKISELTQQRPELRIRLCGIGYTTINETASEKTISKQKTVAIQRATQLADAIKTSLIEEFGINSDQLFSCQSTTESVVEGSSEDARVELLL
mgnify:CR=1 FL=1